MMFDNYEVPLVVSRSAMLPASMARRLIDGNSFAPIAWTSASHRSAFLEALNLASPSLYDAFAKWLLTEDKTDTTVPLRVGAYALRAATRCTPFGLFASIAVTDIDFTTDLRLKADSYSRKVRVDMAWLWRVVRNIELDHEVAKSLTYYANSHVRDCGNRLFFTHFDPSSLETSGKFKFVFGETSILATPMLRSLLALTKHGATFSQIKTEVETKWNSACNDLESLIAQLMRAGALISSIRVSLTDNPLGRLINALPDCNIREALVGIYEQIDALNAASSDKWPLLFRSLSSTCRKVIGSPEVLQVDLSHQNLGALGRDVIADVSKLAQILMRSAPIADLKSYRNQFIERFESQDNVVPLLHLIDVSQGIGPPPKKHEFDQNMTARRKYSLSQLIARSLREGNLEIVISSRELEDILGPLLTAEETPESFEIGFELSSPSAKAIQEGEYLVGPAALTGSPGAGKSAARFADIATKSSQSLMAPVFENEFDDLPIPVDLIFMPGRDRLGNVCILSHLPRHEIIFGVAPSSNESTVLGFDDLLVGLKDNKFKVWSKTLRHEIQIKQNHLLNTQVYGSDACRFLNLIEAQGKRYPVGFNWGESMMDFPMRPRIRHGKIVLALASWSLPRTLLQGEKHIVVSRLNSWRKEFMVPEVVCLSEGDQRLPINFSTTAGLNLLLDKTRAANDEFIPLVEMFPNPEDYWLSDGTQNYKTEFLASFVGKASPANTAPPYIDQSGRKSGPCSSCVYMKLYCGLLQMDEILLKYIKPLVTTLQLAFKNLTFFYIRYFDPRPHLRLRFLTLNDEESLLIRLKMGEVAEELLSLTVIESYSMDTYIREFERYGGDIFFTNVENLFAESSSVILGILAEIKSDFDKRVINSILTFDQVFRNLIMSRDLQRFRKHGRRKAIAFSSAERSGIRRIQNEILRIGPVKPLDSAVTLRAAYDKQLLFKDIDQITSALFHIHCNRMGIVSDLEEAVVRQMLGAVYTRFTEPNNQQFFSILG